MRNVAKNIDLFNKRYRNDNGDIRIVDDIKNKNILFLADNIDN